MPTLTKIYTKTGDDGTTGLGNGQRVKKHSPRIEAFGAVDELNSQIGLALASDLEDQLRRVLQSVQNELFHLGADLCADPNLPFEGRGRERTRWDLRDSRWRVHDG